jgi:hypothetical protein
MRNTWLAMIAVSIGCGLQRGAPTAAECAHDWGAPSGYMATACCRTQQDCVAAGQSSWYCTPPNTPFPMGACPMSNCAADADCRAGGAPSICQPLSCGLTEGGLCVAGCTGDAGCAQGESCELTTNRCHASACATATDCPLDFGCSAGACARTTCTSDDDCHGYCVTGHCYQAAGECRGPVG